MRALVIYWSLHGTTRAVAEHIAGGLRSAGAECTLHDLRSGAPENVTSYDIVGVGSPVHWFRQPTPVTRALAALPPLEGRSTLAFCVHGTYRGAALNRARAALARAGGTEIGAFASYGDDDIHLYTREGWLFSPAHPMPPELQAARDFGIATAAAHRARLSAAASPPPPRTRDPRTYWLYALERLFTGPRLTRLFYARLFRLDPARCTRCGKCARRCPVRNITWERGALPRWGRQCVLCLECVNICPQEAVTCPFDWRLFRPFMRWNVRRALKDPGLDRAAVVHRNGRVERL